MGRHTIELIAKRTRRQYSSFIIDYLEKIQTRELHGVARIIQQVVTIFAPHEGATKPAVHEHGAPQASKARQDPVRFLLQIVPEHAHLRRDPLLICIPYAVRHLAADAETEYEQRNHHHRPERDEEAGAEFHGARWTAPSRSTGPRATPRRTI